jgi:hypothetical protein
VGAPVAAGAPIAEAIRWVEAAGPVDSAEFRVALCIRLRVLPKDTSLFVGTPRMCKCGELSHNSSNMQ